MSCRRAARRGESLACSLRFRRPAARGLSSATRLLGGLAGPARRFVTVRGARSVIAIAVDAVLGVRELGGDGLAAITPLAGAVASDVIAAIGTLDAQLLVVLETAHLVPDAV